MEGGREEEEGGKKRRDALRCYDDVATEDDLNCNKRMQRKEGGTWIADMGCRHPAFHCSYRQQTHTHTHTHTETHTCMHTLTPVT